MHKFDPSKETSNDYMIDIDSKIIVNLLTDMEFSFIDDDGQ